ncbi:hypothetical protein [Microvirga sp. VF16]|uniref:hypothetical protein n=1 Tax=Microvirga sp. VF16 TaxID=2807101 RepID=UPI00193DCBCF|nr:hypothetical protein [Microvirga sp. VF16]QRM35102.1 hypothetical protein JO965_39575 [Microvirga sp. VF16]
MTDAVFKPAVEYPLRAFLDLSTAHLRPETIKHLNELETDDLPFPVASPSTAGSSTLHTKLT